MLPILFSKVLCLGVGGVALVGGVWWVLYERYFHPAWRKNRRLIRACKKAFEDGTYELVRIRQASHRKRPSGGGLLSPSPRSLRDAGILHVSDQRRGGNGTRFF